MHSPLAQQNGSTLVRQVTLQTTSRMVPRLPCSALTACSAMPASSQTCLPCHDTSWQLCVNVHQSGIPCKCTCGRSWLEATATQKSREHESMSHDCSKSTVVGSTTDSRLFSARASGNLLARPTRPGLPVCTCKGLCYSVGCYSLEKHGVLPNWRPFSQLEVQTCPSAVPQMDCVQYTY